MAIIDIFSKIQLPINEVFSHYTNLNNFSRCTTPFFKLENLSCSNSKIDNETFFTQKCTLLELLQLFYKVKEIHQNQKIIFEFNGLLKGTDCIHFIDDENACIIRERLQFSLYNQFNLPLLDLVLSILFYIDTLIKHLRFKKAIYCQKGIKKEDILKEYSTIRSFISINATIDTISSFFDDLNKFSAWLSPLLKIESTTSNEEFKEGNEFNLTFFIPFIPAFKCNIRQKDKRKIIISFENTIIKGKNIWSILPCEEELIIENTIELDYVLNYLKPILLLLSTTLVRNEINNWNKRLKEIAEKTNLTSVLDLSFSKSIY